MRKYELVFNLNNIYVVYKEKSNLYSDFLKLLDKEVPLIFDIRYKFNILSDKLKRNIAENSIEYKIIISAEDVDDVEKSVEEFLYFLKRLSKDISFDYYEL